MPDAAPTKRRSPSDGHSTSIVFESNEGLPTVNNRGKEIKVPSWIISLVQVSVPALAVAIGMYYRIAWTEDKVDILQEIVQQKAKELETTKSKTITIENRYEILKLRIEKDAERIIDRIDRMDTSMREGRKEMKEQMTIIQQDVKELQQRMPKRIP